MANLYKILIPLLAIGAFTIFTAEYLSSGGSPGGYSGSPGDNNSTCTSCHGGTASPQTGWITSNIPVSGYTAGQTYSITATLSHAGAGRYGFEISAENAAAAKTGTFIITNQTETQLTNAGKAVTHTFTGTTGSAGSKNWVFNWQAPASGSGNVTFYAAFNAANGNGTTSGDVIYTSNLLVQENLATAIENVDLPGLPTIYPNPARERIFVASYASLADVKYQFTDLNGKIWMDGLLSGESNEISVNQLPSGMYFLTLGGKHAQKIIIQ